MEAHDFQILQDYLLLQAKDPVLLLRELEWLGPLYKVALSGDYQPVRVDDLPYQQVRTALKAVGAKRPNAMVPISAAEITERPRWMSRDAHRHMLIMSVGLTAGHLVEQSFEQPLWDALGRNRVSAINMQCGDYFGDPLTRSVTELLGEPLDYVMKKVFWRAPTFFLAAAVAGDEKILNRLRPLIRLLPNCFPLGQLEDKKSDWLVLVR